LTLDLLEWVTFGYNGDAHRHVHNTEYDGHAAWGNGIISSDDNSFIGQWFLDYNTNLREQHERSTLAW
jgi:hypothetical protein